jgi:predicted cobalt transporter CbtA
MKALFFVLLIIACFVVGPLNALVSAALIPAMLAEWIITSLHITSNAVFWGVVAFSYLTCLLPFFSKKGTRS